MLPKQLFTSVTNFIFLVLLLCSFGLSCEQVCDPRDESSLLAFSANLSTTSTPLNWSSSTSCCRWEGVDCDTGGRVIGIQLYSRGLKGLISSALGDLVSLTHLNLSNNDLYGPLSEHIFGLTNLRVVDLSTNSISGPIPLVIGNLLNLERLNLGYNNLSGPIPPNLMKCTNLTEIFLGFNHLDGNISKLDLSTLVHLKKLDLINNSFIGTLPESIYSCKSLRAIRVALNNISGQISHNILFLKSLSYLSLSGNSFSNITSIVTILAQSNNLTTLLIEVNFYGESIPTNNNFFGSVGFPQLKYFDLNRCNLTGLFPEWVSNIKTLRTLNLDGNQLTGKIPDSIGTLPYLFYFSVRENHFSGEIPLSLFRLPALLLSKVDPELIHLNLELPMFTYQYKQCTHVTTLSPSLRLANNKFRGQIPLEMGKLQGLRQLFMENNSFSESIPTSLSNMTNLEYLDLSNNNLTGGIPLSLQSLTFLSYLDVSYNHLEGPIPTGAQFDTFEKKGFEGNLGLCGELIGRPCWNPSTTKPTTEDKSINDQKSHMFLEGLLFGFALGLSGIMVVVASYVWFST